MARLFGLVLALVILLLSACTTSPPRIALADLDFGLADPGSGEKLYNQSNNEAPACSACHSITGENSGIGNSLAGVADVAGARVTVDSRLKNFSIGVSCGPASTWSPVTPI